MTHTPDDDLHAAGHPFPRAGKKIDPAAARELLANDQNGSADNAEHNGTRSDNAHGGRRQGKAAGTNAKPKKSRAKGGLRPGNPGSIDNLARIINSWGILRYNVRAMCQEWSASPQWGEFAPAEDSYPRPVTDSDVPRLAVAMVNMDLGLLAVPGSQTLEAALTVAAEQRTYDPVKDYLNRLEWDGVSRLDSMGSTYFGVSPTTYSCAVFAMWMISGVARTYEPGCKVDHVIILEGHQGIRKSSAIEVLAGKENFSDNLPDLGSKDAQDHLIGMWIVEFAELDALSRKDVSETKAFICRSVDRFRKAYGRRTGAYPRRVIFAGTTNSDDYLNDETGARRFWPVHCEAVDIDALKRDRDQLWAEAVVRYHRGERWHITDPDLERAAKDAQAQRRKHHPWEDEIRNYAATRSAVFVDDILEHLGVDLDRRSRRESDAVIAILKANGWEKGPREGTAPRRVTYQRSDARHSHERHQQREATVTTEAQQSHADVTASSASSWFGKAAGRSCASERWANAKVRSADGADAATDALPF